MRRLVSLLPRLALVLLCLGVATTRTALAAGSVAMQVEHLVKQAVEEYNTAMESGDSASFVKYFASNATRESPLSRQSGRADLAKYFDAEFKAYKATWQIKKMVVQGNVAAIEFTWDAVDRKSGDFIKIDMVGVYEVGSSGQFSSVTYYFDTAKARALADLGR
jgi:ketosteroid isomerase-like protein